jgi:hypothetical protein
LHRITAKRYRYKDDKYGAGQHYGAMAQDLLKSKAGASMVRDAPDGLEVDLGKMITTLLATSARLNERMRKLEGGGK